MCASHPLREPPRRNLYGGGSPIEKDKDLSRNGLLGKGLTSATYCRELWGVQSVFYALSIEMGFCTPYISQGLDKHSRGMYNSEPIPDEIRASPTEKMVSMSF